MDNQLSYWEHLRQRDFVRKCIKLYVSLQLVSKSVLTCISKLRQAFNVAKYLTKTV